MTVLGTGIDLVEIARFERSGARLGSDFLLEFLTPSEAADCFRRAFPYRIAAARFAAKEAVLKALGTGRGRNIAWHDVAILELHGGLATTRLAGEAARLAKELGVRDVRLSFAVTGAYALAWAVLEGVEVRRDASISAI